MSKPLPFANIVITVPPYRTLTYRIPDALHNCLKPGCRVIVPLGNRHVTGFVVDLAAHCDLLNVKDILEVPDTEPVLAGDILKLTAWITHYYMANWGEVIRAALPPVMQQKSRQHVFVNENSDESLLTPDEKNLMQFLRKKKPETVSALQKSIKDDNLMFHLRALQKKEAIEIRHHLKSSRIKQRTRTWVCLTNRPDEETLLKIKKRAPRQFAVLDALIRQQKELPRSAFDLPLATLRRLQECGWLTLRDEIVLRDPFENLPSQSENQFVLTEEQNRAFQAILSAIQDNAYRTFMLHGVTGSGKTQVYIEAIRKVLETGRSALVLIPEISLTPQAVIRYRSAFKTQVAVLHSKMSAGERYDAWQQIRDGKCKIAIGPRSAIFAPLVNLGLIVVDEEHETSYKQIDPAPRYNARDVAVFRGSLNQCPVILGSATPSLESYYNARRGKYQLLKLTHRIDHIPMPKTRLVNSRDPEKGSNPILSHDLKNAIETRLKRNEQIILLQNRRGYSVFLQCGHCGHIESCDHCDITMTYHARNHELVCHYCGARIRAPEKCSQCQGHQIKYQGVGTQRVEDILSNLFPKARVLRMDMDTTTTKHAHTKIITTFEKQEADILLGTQMVAKGHDFPGVHLVGIISADTGLIFPDFRAGERTFQLITQAAGRAGRKEKQGEVIVQSLQPEHPILRLAITHNYNQFYHKEILDRRALNYPPFGRLLLIRFKGSHEEDVYKASVFFRQFLPDSPELDILGPAAAPIRKIRDLYRYQIILRASKKADPGGDRIRKVTRHAWQQYNTKGGPPQIRISVDVDPVDLL